MSSNNYPFIVIIAHYVNNHGELGKAFCQLNLKYLTVTTEELLIDFCKLLGRHTGENMAEAV